MVWKGNSFCMAYFQGRAVRFRECTSPKFQSLPLKSYLKAPNRNGSEAMLNFRGSKKWDANPPINHHQSPITNAWPGDTLRFKVKIPVRNVKKFTSPSTPCLSEIKIIKLRIEWERRLEIDTKRHKSFLAQFYSVSSIFPYFFPFDSKHVFRKIQNRSPSSIPRSKTRSNPSHVVLRSPTAQSVAAPQDSGFSKNSIRVKLACLEVCRHPNWLVSKLGSGLELNFFEANVCWNYIGWICWKGNFCSIIQCLSCWEWIMEMWKSMIRWTLLSAI